MQEKWMMKTTASDCKALAEKYNISPIMAFLILNREVREEDIPAYLSPDVTNMHNGKAMKDMENAVSVLKEKIRNKRPIRVVGDYDIDGICATYILTDAIETAGGVVDMQIPERIKDGYGINDEIIMKAADDGIDTIITCDNGIAAVNQARVAKSNGITFIVTDHHEIPYDEKDGEKIYILPEADAIVNPKQSDCPYPFKGLCGAAVAYKFVEQIVASKEKLDEYMMFAAIATIGDIMELKDENRIIVKKGLQLLRKTDHIGLNALIRATKVNKITLDTYHIGFIIGPCINASGRLETATKAYRLLRAETVTEADGIAEELVNLNEQRKIMTREQTDVALETAKNSTDNVLVIYLEKCHESIAGIVAGRVRESVCKPVFIVTQSENGYKGSGRSIEAYNMYEEMTKCKKYFSKYGGHKMAAGFSFESMEDVDGFRKEINSICTLMEEDFVNKVSIDMELPFIYVTEKLINDLELLAPFGNGNEKPVFAVRNMEIIKLEIIGRLKNTLKFTLADNTGHMMKAMYFGDVDKCMDFLAEKYGADNVNKAQKGMLNPMKMTITFYPQINEYNGNKSVNIVIGHYC
ncbi:MAG: single-stranded-DNA-specific exonuclease RecJ [Lachnospiraceae bacterium]|nr:single-stranded-DNA-specific exonuclease RecJ [Lachnospiraceae bacterium]